MMWGSWKSSRGRARLAFLGGMAATISALVWMSGVDPGGIVPFELSGTRSRAWEHIAGWKAAGTLNDARAHTIRDYAFMSAYWIPIAAACIGLAHRVGGRDRGRVFAAAAFVAVLFDAIENVFLLRMISGGREATDLGSFSQEVEASIPALATFAALIKFALLLSAIGYALIGLAKMLRAAVSRRR